MPTVLVSLKSLSRNPLWAISLGLIINLLIYGYDYGNNSYHDYILPYIHKLINPSLYPKDLYIQTLDFFPSLYIPLMAFMGKFVSLERAHFVMYLGIKLLFFSGISYLTRYLFKNPFSCFLSVFLFACSPLSNSFGLLGDEPVLKFLLYQSTFIMPFLIFVIYFFLTRKYWASFLLLAVCYYFNALLCNYVAVMLLFGSFTILKRDTLPQRKLKLFFSWLIFAVLLMPGLFWMLTKTTFLRPSQDFIELLRNYYAGHYFPLSWESLKWVRVVTYVIFLILLFRQTPSDDNKKIVEAMMKGIGAMWVLAFIAAEVIPLRTFVVLMFFRSDIFFVTLSFLYISEYLQRLIFSQRQKDTLIAFLVLLGFADFHLGTFLTPVLPMMVGLVAIDLFLQKQDWPKTEKPKNFGRIFFSLYVILFLLICVLWSYRSPLFLKTSLLILTATAFLLLAESRAAFQLSPERKNLIFYGILLLVLLTHVDVIQYRIKTKTIAYQTPIRTQWQDVQRWAKDNTSPDSLFLTPPYLSGFRSFSQRSVFVEKIDGGAMHWMPGFEAQWAQRLGELGHGEFPLLHFESLNPKDPLTIATRSVYSNLSEEKIIQLANTDHIDFVIVENPKKLSFPLIYTNDLFSVYKIP